MAQIVTITNPLTGQPAQVDQLDHTAQQIDDGIARALPGGAIDLALSTKPGQNLLDNWYFANPVNQRGQTSYTDSGYTIDRWLNDSLTYVTIAENKIICGSTVANYSAFKQIIENPSQYIGKTLTFSVLGRAISGSPSTFIPYHGTVPLKNELSVVSHTFVYGSASGEVTSNLQVNVWANNTVSSFEIVAAKLELGTQQTLAHQENGNWVLNEIPDYEEQLAKCQYYSRFFGEDIEIPCSNNPAGTYIEGTLPLTMRSGNGSISYSEGVLFTGNGTFYTVTSASVSSNGGRVKIGANVNGQLSTNLQATLFLKNCSILFNL